MPAKLKALPALALALLLSAAGAGAQSAALCAGDCDDDRTVVISELVEAVAVGLGFRPVSRCLAADSDGDGAVRVAEIVLAVGTALSACAALPDLPLQQRYPMYWFPTFGRGPTLADLNSDGHLDLLTQPVGGGSPGVLVRLGAGDGSFSATQLSPALLGSNLSQVAVADLNRDGRADVVASNATVGSMFVFLGGGDGTFAPAVDYPAGRRPNSITLGDLNADGALDAAVGNTLFNSVSVWLGNDDGTFAAEVVYQTGGNFPHVAGIVDATGDGLPDLVVGNQEFGVLATLPGRGDGTLAEPIVTRTGRTLFAPVVADFNRDGAIDIASPNTLENSLGVYLGRNDGTFAALPPIATGAQGFDLAVGDVDRDGILDIVAPFRGLVEEADTGTVLVLLGRGDGTFARTSVRLGDDIGHVVALGDVNEDGALDIALLGGAVILGHGDGRFVTGQRYDRRGNTFGLQVGDFDEDGRPDVVTLVRGGASNSSCTLEVLLGTAGRSLTALDPIDLSAFAPVLLATADMNRDGHLDLVARSPERSFPDPVDPTIIVLLGDGRGRFTVSHTRAYRGSFGSPGVVAADFTGDAIPDVVDDGYFLFPGVGDGSLGVPRPLVVRGTSQHLPSKPQAIDVNRDGVMDLVFVSGANTVVAIGSGDGTFTATYGSPLSTDNSHALTAVGDADGDGHLDLAGATGDSPLGVPRMRLHLSRGNGDGTFGAPMFFPTEPARTVGTGSTSVVDIDRDGRMDIVASFGHKLTVLPGTGGGAFGPPKDFYIGFDARHVVANMNHDALPDIVFEARGAVDVWYAADAPLSVSQP